MLVDQGVEGHPVPPAGGKVVDVDVGIPEEETQLVVMMFLTDSNAEERVKQKAASFTSSLHNIRTLTEVVSPGRLHLTPEQQSVFGRSPLFVVLSLHTDVLDLETQSHLHLT